MAEVGVVMTSIVDIVKRHAIKGKERQVVKMILTPLTNAILKNNPKLVYSEVHIPEVSRIQTNSNAISNIPV